MEQSKHLWQYSMQSLKVIVHSFIMGDVEDPDLFAAMPLFEWEKTEKGKWVIDNSVKEVYWQRLIDYNSLGYKYQVVAEFTESNYTYYKLKYE